MRIYMRKGGKLYKKDVKESQSEVVSILEGCVKAQSIPDLLSLLRADSKSPIMFLVR